MIMITRRAILLYALALPLAAGAAAQDKLAGKLTITGSSTIAPLALELAKAFEKMHPETRIDVQTGGSSRGVNDARSGLADIGMASRALYDTEKDLVGSVIALDGICIILHKSNPVDQLSNQQIIDIYTGKITDWSEVGGTPGRITVVNKAEGRSTLDLFLSFFKLKNSAIKASVVIGDNQQGVKTVIGNPGAIGYVSVGTAEYEAEQGAALKLLAMGGVNPSTANVKNGTFPLTRPLNLVTKTEPQGLAKAFIDFARSKEAHPFIKEQFFVPLEN